MPEKKESQTYLKSQYAGSFRDGLRLPILDANPKTTLLVEEDEGDLLQMEQLELDGDNNSNDETRTGGETSLTPSGSEGNINFNRDRYRDRDRRRLSPSLSQSVKGSKHNNNNIITNSSPVLDSLVLTKKTKRQLQRGKKGKEKIIMGTTGTGTGKATKSSCGNFLLEDEDEEDDLIINYDTDEGLVSGMENLTLANDSGSHTTLSSSNNSQDNPATASSSKAKAVSSKINKPRGATATNKGSHLEVEINQRISSVYRSIENLEKKRVNFNNSIRAATRRTVADGVKNKNKSFFSKLPVTNASSTTLESEALQDQQEVGSEQQQHHQFQQQLQQLKKPSRIIDVTRTYPKMFGLDPMKVIASSEDDSSDVDKNGNGNGGVKDPRKKTKKSIRKYLEHIVKEEPPRDMSAIMPTLSEKTFLTKLQKRESQLNKEINDMKSNLDVMNMKAEREAKKAKAERNKNKNSPANKQLNVTRLMPADPDKGPARELTEYLQATGGSTGGWETEDHHVFLRSYSKWLTRPTKLVENLCQLLPTKKPEEIVEHVAWYEKYDKLNNANRAHIRQWQINKRKERELVFQMASQSQRARLETEKRHQDTIQLKRSEERQKNKDILSEWKRSKHSVRGRRSSFSTTNMMLLPGEDEADEMDTTEKISKMDLELSGIRKEVREITSMTRDIGKTLRTVNQAEINKLDRAPPPPAKGKQKQRSGTGTGAGTIGRTGTAVSDASSGFCEMTVDEINTVRNELAGDGEKFLRTHEEIVAQRSPDHPPVFYSKLQRDPTQVAETKKLFREFRNRDEEMMQAKKKAILGKKEKMRNRSYLTDQEVKERMKKITAPSKVMKPTKQWEIRKEIRELEKSENKNREEGNPWASQEFKDSYNASAFVNNIPKLGMPSWRRNVIS